MGEGSDRHELEERRAALRRLLPVVERLRGLDGVTWAGGQRHRNGAYLVRYPTYDEDTLAVMEAFGGGCSPGTGTSTNWSGAGCRTARSPTSPGWPSGRTRT